MKTIARLLLATLLALSAGCAQKDWIDRTLVTVDVTGTWYGIAGTGGGGGVRREMFLELMQEGSRVTGSIRIVPLGAAVGGLAIDGTVAGDVFRFKDSKGSMEGELTVSGDEMNGRASFYGGGGLISLRRVDPSSRPASPR